MPRPPVIDRAAVLAAALALADDEGLAAVSMRAVAQRLGVTPMALYRHIGDKQQLLDGIVERLLTELPLPEPGLQWQERLVALGAELRRTALRHPSVFPILLQRPAATAGALRVREAVYTALRDGGVPAEDVPRAERVLSTYVLGFAASQAGGRFSVGAHQLDADFAWSTDRLVRALVDAPAGEP